MITGLDASLGNDHVRMHLHKTRHHREQLGERHLGAAAWYYPRLESRENFAEARFKHHIPGLNACVFLRRCQLPTAVRSSSESTWIFCSHH